MEIKNTSTIIQPRSRTNQRVAPSTPGGGLPHSSPPYTYKHSRQKKNGAPKVSTNITSAKKPDFCKISTFIISGMVSGTSKPNTVTCIYNPENTTASIISEAKASAGGSRNGLASTRANGWPQRGQNAAFPGLSGGRRSSSPQEWQEI